MAAVGCPGEPNESDTTLWPRLPEAPSQRPAITKDSYEQTKYRENARSPAGPPGAAECSQSSGQGRGTRYWCGYERGTGRLVCGLLEDQEFPLAHEWPAFQGLPPASGRARGSTVCDD